MIKIVSSSTIATWLFKKEKDTAIQYVQLNKTYSTHLQAHEKKIHR